jgi:hypothetical protein
LRDAHLGEVATKSPMSQKFEARCDEFIKELGGERIPPADTPGEQRADYLFARCAALSIDVIIELKSLEDEGYERYLEKLRAMSSEWLRTGKLIVVGKAAVNYRDLSPELRRDWDAILSPFVQNLVRKANRQIKKTKIDLNLPDAQGVILCANEGNYAHFPTDFMSLVSRLFDPKRNLYTSTDSVEYFSTPGVGLASVGGLPNGAGWFMGGQRDPKNQALEAFRANMRKRYGEWLAREQGLIHREHMVDPDAIHKARPRFGIEVVRTVRK